LRFLLPLVRRFSTLKYFPVFEEIVMRFSPKAGITNSRPFSATKKYGTSDEFFNAYFSSLPVSSMKFIFTAA
jgi:hypothetical protein